MKFRSLATFGLLGALTSTSCGGEAPNKGGQITPEAPTATEVDLNLSIQTGSIDEATVTRVPSPTRRANPTKTPINEVNKVCADDTKDWCNPIIARGHYARLDAQTKLSNTFCMAYVRYNSADHRRRWQETKATDSKGEAKFLFQVGGNSSEGVATAEVDCNGNVVVTSDFTVVSPNK